MDEVLGIALRTYFHSDIYFPQGTKPFGWNLTFSLTQTNELISLQAKQQSPWVIFFIISQHDGDSCISPLTFCIVPVLYSCGTRTLGSAALNSTVDHVRGGDHIGLYDHILLHT